MSPDPLFSHAGRRVVLTGGGSGIGRAAALAFAGRGARVMILGRGEEALAETVRRGAGAAAAAGGEIRGRRADVTRPGDLEAAAEAAAAAWGAIDVWINNAGASERAVLPEPGADADHLERLLSVNVTGVWNGCRAAVARMRGRGGVILNVSSYLSRHAGASAGVPAYTASKGAVSALTRSLAVRHGPDGIRVNSVAPALVLTGFNRELWEDSPDLLTRARELGERYPLGRCGLPGDVAAALLFLASDEAGWITGHELVVDGGVSAR